MKIRKVLRMESQKKKKKKKSAGKGPAKFLKQLVLYKHVAFRYSFDFILKTNSTVVEAVIMSTPSGPFLHPPSPSSFLFPRSTFSSVSHLRHQPAW